MSPDHRDEVIILGSDWFPQRNIIGLRAKKLLGISVNAMAVAARVNRVPRGNGARGLWLLNFSFEANSSLLQDKIRTGG